MTKIDIRVASSKDAAAIAILGAATFKETFEHLFRDSNDLHHYLEQTFSLEKIRNSMSKPENVYWIAMVDKVAVGYAKLKLNAKTEFLQAIKVAQLQKIYILRQYHALKIGRQLQGKLLQSAVIRVRLSVLGVNDKVFR